MTFESYRKKIACKYCKKPIFWDNRLPYNHNGSKHDCEEYRLHKQAQYINSFSKPKPYDNAYSGYRYAVKREKYHRKATERKSDGGIVVIEEENISETPIIERRLNEDGQS
jgi:hypothetical protein